MSVAETGTRGSRPGELHRRRILLLAESAGLAAVLNHLLDPADRLSRIGSLRELTESRSLDGADVVVLDVPREHRAAAISQIRRCHLGPLVVLVARGDDTRALHLDNAATLLTRPFSADELGAALAVPGHRSGLGPFWATIEATAPAMATEPVAAAPAAGTGTATAAPADKAGTTIDPKAAARKAPLRRAPATPPGRIGLVERGQRLLTTATQGWKARRRVRVAGFSVFALIVFTAAFALAANGRCGPGCDALGTRIAPAPTVAPSESWAASTTSPKRSTTTSSPTGSPSTDAFRGIAGGRVLGSTTTTTARKATTTTQEPAGSPTTRPATTRPATTQTTAPPTTAPPTTAPPTTAPPTTSPPTTAGA